MFCLGRILAPKPKPLAPFANFLKPFSLGSWLGILLCLTLSMLAFTALNVVWDGDTNVQISLMQIYSLMCSQSQKSDLANNKVDIF